MATILFIPVGIPGCGKSHLAHALNVNVVSTDAIRATMGDMNDQSNNDEVFKRFYSDIHNYLWLGTSVYADATNLEQKSRAALRDIAEKVSDPLGFSVRTHLILFKNPVEAIRRNRKRERCVPNDVMYRMIEKYERAIVDIENESYDFVTEVSATR